MSHESSFESSFEKQKIIKRISGITLILTKGRNWKNAIVSNGTIKSGGNVIPKAVITIRDVSDLKIFEMIVSDSDLLQRLLKEFYDFILNE